jgi:hypothetical protein
MEIHELEAKIAKLEEQEETLLATVKGAEKQEDQDKATNELIETQKDLEGLSKRLSAMKKAEEREATRAAGNCGITVLDGEAKEERKLQERLEDELGKATYKHLIAGKALDGAAKEMIEIAEKNDGVSYDGKIAIPGHWLSANKAVIDQATSALTPTSVADAYVEAIREAAIYLSVGCTVYDNLNGEDFKIPVAGKITSAHASAENSAATDGGAQFAPVTLQADRITTYADLSNKINLQNGDIAMRAVMSEIGLSVAETINDAMFPTATLTNAPASIAATSGVGTFTEAGTYAAPSNTTPGSVHADLVKALVTLTQADALKGNLAYVGNPELMTDLIKAAAIVGVSPALQGSAKVGNSGQAVNGYPIYWTNSATSSAGVSGDFIFGNFRKVHVGFFGSLVIQNDIFTQNLKDVTRLVAHRYYDFKLVQGAAFVKATSLSA